MRINEFTVLSENVFQEPRVVTLPDGRMFRVFGIWSVYSRLTGGVFHAANAEWRLAGRWMTRMAINSKASIDLAAHMAREG